MEHIKYQNMIDDLCKKGCELANKILDEEIIADDSKPIIEVDNEYPEKLGAISGFIDTLIKAKNSI